MGIITQTAFICRFPVPPRCNLYPGIPFIQPLLILCPSDFPRLCNPVADFEFPACRQKTVLHQNQIQKFPAQPLEISLFTRTVCRRNFFLQPISTISNSLSYHIDQIIFEIIITGITVSHRQHQLRSLLRFLRWVIHTGTSPTGSTVHFLSRTGTKYRLHSSFPDIRTIVNRLRQYLPDLPQAGIVTSITGLHIPLHPLFLCKFFRPPGQLQQQLVHHRIILNPLHCNSDSAQSTFPQLPGSIKSVDHPVHPSVHPDITTEIQQHTIQPVVLSITVLPVPGRLLITPHRTILAAKIQYQHISGFNSIQYLRPGISLPGLNNPDSRRISTLHGFQNRFAGSSQINPLRTSSLVKRIHTVKPGFPEQLFHFRIVQTGNTLKCRVFRLQKSRTGKTAPLTRIGYIQPQFLLHIMRYHTGIPRENGFYTEFPHPV